MTNNRYDRSIRFFAQEGQDRLAATTVAVVGIGGLGTHVVQQLALLGVGQLFLIDHEELEDTNRNRYVGVRHDDPVPGTLKVNIGARLVSEANPDVRAVRIPQELQSRAAFDAIKASDYVFGCLDDDGPRLILTELCSAYSKPYFDLASDIASDGSNYGGRVCVAWDGGGCLECYEELDSGAVQRSLAGEEARQDQAAIYGVPQGALGEVGPSVVSINGVVASLAVTEFMLVATGLRDSPRGLLTYYAEKGVVRSRTSEAATCYCCSGIQGKAEAADVERYLLNEAVRR